MNCSQVTCAFFMRSTFRRISIVGQWFPLSQSKFGRKIRNEMNAPSQIHGVRSNHALAGHDQRQEKCQPEK